MKVFEYRVNCKLWYWRFVQIGKKLLLRRKLERANHEIISNLQSLVHLKLWIALKSTPKFEETSKRETNAVCLSVGHIKEIVCIRSNYWWRITDFSHWIRILINRDSQLCLSIRRWLRSINEDTSLRRKFQAGISESSSRRLKFGVWTKKYIAWKLEDVHLSN